MEMNVTDAQMAASMERAAKVSRNHDPKWCVECRSGEDGICSNLRDALCLLLLAERVEARDYTLRLRDEYAAKA